MRWKPYPSYSDTGDELLGSIPSHWKAYRIKHLADVRLSNVDKLSLDDQAIVRLANYVDVYKNERITADMDLMVATASDDQIERLALAAQDVLITKDSESPNDIAVPAYVPEPMEGVVCGYHLALLRPDADRLHGGFLHRWLQGKASQAYFSSHANGMTRYGIGRGDIGDAPLLWAPLEEQKAIAAFLDRETAKIDTLIAEQQTLNDRLREKRHATILHATTKGINRTVALKASEADWVGEVPEHWQVLRLKHVSQSVQTGTTPDLACFSDTGLDWYTPGDFNGDLYLGQAARLISQDARVDRSFPEGSVLIVAIGSIGKVAIAPRACSANQQINAIVPNDLLTSKFLAFYLATQETVLRAQANSSTLGIMNQEKTRQILIPAPPVEEQLSITAYLEEACKKFDALIAEAETSIALLQEHRVALITAVVTGKVDVRNAVKGDA